MGQAVRPGGIPRGGALQSLPHSSIKPNVPPIRNDFTFKANSNNMIKLPNLTVRGSYNVPSSSVMSPDMMNTGSHSTRFGGTPVKLVNEAKRDLNAPVI